MSTTPMPRRRVDFDRTRNHWWWRDGWKPGTRYITWHLTFEGATALHRAAGRGGEALRAVPGVDVVPVDWLHLTMTGVGFAEDFDAPTLSRIAGAGLDLVSDLAITPLVFDRQYLLREGVCLSTTAPWVQELHALQDDLGRSAGGEAPRPDDSFHPHVSLAYYSTEVDEPAIGRALDAADIRPIVVPAPRLSLLELGRDDRVYTWRVLAQRTLDA